MKTENQPGLHAEATEQVFLRIKPCVRRASLDLPGILTLPGTGGSRVLCVSQWEIQWHMDICGGMNIQNKNEFFQRKNSGMEAAAP